MSNLSPKQSNGIENISEAISRTMKKFNDLELDKDLSVIISVEIESKELNSNKKDVNYINKSSFEKDSMSLKNLKFENNINNSNLEENNETTSYDFIEIKKNNLVLNEIGGNFINKKSKNSIFY